VAKNEGKAAPVNQLTVTTDAEKALFQQGESMLYNRGHLGFIFLVI
jgi:hypothetical protein